MELAPLKTVQTDTDLSSLTHVIDTTNHHIVNRELFRHFLFFSTPSTLTDF